MSMVELEHALTAWLIRCGLEACDEAEMLGVFCDRLVDAGIPLWRVAIGAKLLHPLLDARGCRWRRGEGCVKEDYAREEVSDVNEEWLSSPFYHLLHRLNADHLRRRLDADYRRGEFPLLDRFMDEGSTDYLALAVDLGPRPRKGTGGMLCSFQVDRPSGFTDDEIDLLRRLALPLALARQATTAAETAVTLVTTYLGADAGRRVLDGAIARGTAESVRAVLWYSDLEGFTRIADTAPADELMALLNDHAETVVGSVHAHGGQVLKFIGDGVLAMFPLADGSAPCTRALNAAVEAAAATERLNERRLAAGQLTSDIHVALHVGDVLYGNIGSPDRLDFTVVGPAVNEVARIEALCRTLDQQVIVSSAFANDAGPARLRLVSLGRYALKGVRRPEELFTLDAEA
ncbi:MAG: adenylate/guanylate cyclase domain-containing protein [Geminicoccaceae bacterium]